ncbi:hypothetical protein SprV_0802492200 [Sparganum proliferum]
MDSGPLVSAASDACVSALQSANTEDDKIEKLTDRQNSPRNRVRNPCPHSTKEAATNVANPDLSGQEANGSCQKFFIVCASQQVADRLLGLKAHHFEYCGGPCALPAAEDASSQTESDLYAPSGEPSPYIYLKADGIPEDREGEEEVTSKDESISSTTVSSICERTKTAPPVGKNSSIVTIFSMWSTMMGTSILTMPWAIQQAGFALGIFLITLVAFVMCYLAYRILKSSAELAAATHHPNPCTLDFSKACSHYMGKTGKVLCLFSSILCLTGALVVYYVLLVNFAYNTGTFIRYYVNRHIDLDGDNSSQPRYGVICEQFADVANLTGNFTPTVASEESLFDVLWSPTRTVPAWLLLIIFPLISIRSPTFFTKFTALGTVSILYIFILTFAKAGIWGIHVNFSEPTHLNFVPLYSPLFPALTGVCTLAFFIHNSIESIMRCNKNQKNNARDLLMAFLLVALTYIIVGVVFYLAFPEPKSCIADNLLNNLTSADIFGFVGRLALLFQILTVYPLLMYVLRVEVMHTIFHSVYPGFWKVSVFHLIMLLICLLFAMFSGSFSALIYIFALPCLVYILSLMRVPAGRTNQTDAEPACHSSSQKVPPKLGLRHLTPFKWAIVAFHIFLILLGTANFVAQFVLSFA